MFLLLLPFLAHESKSDIWTGVRKNYRKLAGKDDGGDDDDMPAPNQNKRVKVCPGFPVHMRKMGES